MAPTPSFRIETDSGESGSTIKLTGELDSATSQALVERFERLLAVREGGEVVVDLNEVSFIDSAGMRAIIVIERTAQERDIPLILRPPPGPVTELLELTGMGERIVLRPQADYAPATPFIERVDLELAREPTTPGRARAELREAIAGRLRESDRATLTLLTSELVTNSVIHPDPGAGGPIGLRITTYHDRVRVEVSDGGSGFDVSTPRPRPRGAGGHGLVVVDGLSTRWGTRRVEDDAGERFCVWFELDVADAGENDGLPATQLSAPSRSQQ